MSLHWYACISMNTYCYIIYYIFSEMDWWVLFNTSLIMWIHPVVHEILANKYFTVTDDLISQLFIITFVHPIYVQIALIWSLIIQLSLGKLVYWLWYTSWMKFVTSSYFIPSQFIDRENKTLGSIPDISNKRDILFCFIPKRSLSNI